ncbi:hypothetical protein ACQ4WX_03025 [Streptomyces lasalocidi]|uniref:hypothetical protein n=1 Tax=Streptomyces sp. MUSC 14 TaxID=1354889 RepID=UPI00210B37DD|nr:hypothetical protein [Streptomyces sp. MUSC 14]
MPTDRTVGEPTYVPAVHPSRQRPAGRTRGPFHGGPGPHGAQPAFGHDIFDHNTLDLVEPQILEEYITHGRS